MPSVIAVDLGGTNLRIGLVSGQGKVLSLKKLPSNAGDPADRLLARIGDAIEEVSCYATPRGSLSGLALGFPGIVDGQKGIVYRSPHFPSCREVAVSAYFKERFPAPVVLDNDCHMVARGEAWKGAGRGKKNFLLLTLGTGVGGAIFWNGEILSGDSGFAGEMGHITLETEGPRCACGSRGCLEMYVSATGILHAADRKGMTVAQLFEEAKQGDRAARAIFQRMGYYLGIGIASLVNITGIETVIIGGGVSGAWDLFIDPARKELAQRTYPETAERVVIKRAELGDEAGLIGGAAAVLEIIK